MKISSTDMVILQNFASINNSIQFRAGDVVKTKLVSNNLMATAKLSDTVPCDFAILDLNRFLSAISLFKDGAELVIKDNENAIITDGKNSVCYAFTAPEIISKTVVSDYNKKTPVPDTVAKFTLTNEDLKKVKGAANSLSLPNIVFESKNGDLLLIARDSKVDSSDSYSHYIGPCDVEFTADMKIEALKFIPSDYEVSVSERIAITFEGPICTYMVAAAITV